MNNSAATRMSFRVKSPRGRWRYLLCAETVVVGCASVFNLARGIHSGALTHTYASVLLGFFFCGRMTLYLGRRGRQFLGRYVITDKKLLAVFTYFFGRGLILADIAAAVPFSEAPSPLWLWLGKSGPT